MEEEIFARLRYCFIAGYTLPQYCVDNNIKQPLFIFERKSEEFLKEVHAQFKCDKRLVATYCFIDDKDRIRKLPMDGAPLIAEAIFIRNISAARLAQFDKIILLTKKEYRLNAGKVIRFTDLEKFFVQRTYVDIPLLNFLQRHPKVKLFLTNFPNIRRYKGGAEFNSKLWDYRPLQKALIESEMEGVSMHTPFDEFGYTNSQVISLLKDARSKRNLDGSTSMLEDDDPLFNIQDGKRVTAYQPDKFLNRIYIFGTCHYFGTNAPFDKTIASYLQKMLNENNLPYRVENEGQCFWSRHQDMFYNLNSINPEAGDIIFINVSNLDSNDKSIPFFNVNNTFDPPNDYRKVFCRKGHVNELGYKLLADKYFKFLTENNFFRDVEFKYPPPPTAYFHRYGIPPQFEQGGSLNSSYGQELENYKKSLRAKKIPVGALVMNCNPFTLGHLYLVEYAAAKVTRLYIFVVEEDKSEFPFADRIELVRQGVKHIPNVEVLPSGKFIISQQTFSGYFNKASLQDVQVDSSEDVEIFGKEIAPELGITIRFAGEEPKDNVTRQYNETMKRILPRYGVEFCEIPRKTFGDEPISASTVRAALNAGDIEKVKNLVPDTTFEYLRTKHPVFSRYFTARIDVKFMSTIGKFQIISVSDGRTILRKPKWFQQGGIGYQLQSCVGKLRIVTKATADGQVWLCLRSVDIRQYEDNAKRIPYWIDYANLIINGKMIFDTITPAWHDKPCHYLINVKAGEELTIQAEWLPHKNDAQ